MDYHVTPQASAQMARAKIERISEPWALNKTVSIAVTFGLALVLGSWAANGQIENIILFVIWLVAVLITVFVQDQWWPPALVITALSIGTVAFGFPLTGMEVGVVIVALTLPVKLAMKTLRKAEPEMSPSAAYWCLLIYIAVQAIVIITYHRIEGDMESKSIYRAYYDALTPLIYFGLLVRYCQVRTVRPAIITLFFVSLFVCIAAMTSILLHFTVEPLSNLKITIGWLDGAGARLVLSTNGPQLLIGGLAFWPAAKKGHVKFLLGLGMMVGFFGTMVSGGRTPLGLCLLAFFIFAIIRRQGVFLIAGIFCVVTLSLAASSLPDIIEKLPELAQRSLAPLNFSEQNRTAIQDTLESSNQWHEELRERSIDYWLEDSGSFLLGHGFKNWQAAEYETVDNMDYERLMTMAIEMGRTENMFSSITNIFGLAGLLLYAWFLGDLALKMYRVYRIAPKGSPERALCEFSLINLSCAMLFAPLIGTTPHLELVYWLLGILGARNYLKGAVKPQKAEAQLPKFIPAGLRAGV